MQSQRDAFEEAVAAGLVPPFDDAVSAEGADGVADGGAAAAALLTTGQPGGPLPFRYTDMALADAVAAQHPDLKYTDDKGWVKLENGVYMPTKTVLRPIAEVCAAIGAPYRAQGPQQAVTDMALNGHREHDTVEKTLRHHPAVFASGDQFDADPWLLNTPEFIIDLRDGSTLPHGVLMRNQTAVTPDVLAYNDYRECLPSLDGVSRLHL